MGRRTRTPLESGVRVRRPIYCIGSSFERSGKWRLCVHFIGKLITQLQEICTNKLSPQQHPTIMKVEGGTDELSVNGPGKTK
jgi:hypothetical protein